MTGTWPHIDIQVTKLVLPRNSTQTLFGPERLPKGCIEICNHLIPQPNYVFIQFLKQKLKNTVGINLAIFIKQCWLKSINAVHKRHIKNEFMESFKAKLKNS